MAPSLNKGIRNSRPTKASFLVPGAFSHFSIEKEDKRTE
jgi:hypothetical protein